MKMHSIFHEDGDYLDEAHEVHRAEHAKSAAAGEGGMSLYDQMVNAKRSQFYAGHGRDIMFKTFKQWKRTYQ